MKPSKELRRSLVLYCRILADRTKEVRRRLAAGQMELAIQSYRAEEFQYPSQLKLAKDVELWLVRQLSIFLAAHRNPVNRMDEVAAQHRAVFERRKAVLLSRSGKGGSPGKSRAGSIVHAPGGLKKSRTITDGSNHTHLATSLS